MLINQRFPNSLSTLRVLDLYDIDWTGNNSVADTTLLNTMVNMFHSLVTGRVNISGAVRTQEIASYNAAWSDLIVSYSGQMIPQYLVTYVNADANNTELCSVWVDSGTVPPDPYASGILSVKPSLAPDEQYTYTFGTEEEGEYIANSGWAYISNGVSTSLANLNGVSSDITLTAVYTRTTRIYTVRWFARSGLQIGESVQAPYGTEVVYSGELPTDTSGESSLMYKVFKGWNKSTGFIRGDTDVLALWEEGGAANNKDLSEMNSAEIYGVCKRGEAGTKFEDKDHFDIVLGHDFNFANVNSAVLLENRFFDGTNYVDTEVQLFNADAPSFTLAIEYEFLNSTDSNGTLASASVNNDGEGFKLQYSSSTPTIKWGDKSTTVGADNNRGIVVLRHQRGSNNLFIYSDNNNTDTYNLAIKSVESVRTSATNTNQVLSFGAIRNADGTQHGFFAKGWIHWAKIWYDDLGADNAGKLASWIHETLRMEYYGANRYYLANSMTPANASFIANNPLSLLRRMNSTSTNSGGWAACEMRTFVNNRLLNAMSPQWQSILKTVTVKSSAGLQSTNIVTSNDKIYLLAYREFGGSGSPYTDEVDVNTTISFFTSNAKRVKFSGVIIRDDVSYISSDTEPTLLTTQTVHEGDIWIKTNSDNYGYVYISAETKAQHSKIGWQSLGSSTAIQASDGGVWVRAYHWWERSPYASYSSYFMIVYLNGNPNNGNYASNSSGVVVGFSI